LLSSDRRRNPMADRKPPEPLPDKDRLITRPDEPLPTTLDPGGPGSRGGGSIPSPFRKPATATPTPPTPRRTTSAARPDGASGPPRPPRAPALLSGFVLLTAQPLVLLAESGQGRRVPGSGDRHVAVVLLQAAAFAEARLRRGEDEFAAV